MTFINAAHYDNSSSVSAVITKPTDTADNDIMFAVLGRVTGTDPSTVPTGWALLGKNSNGSSGVTRWLYWKLAATEGANYTWEWAGAERTGGTIATFRSGFNTADPIDVTSNTAYETLDTTVRGASMIVAATGSTLVFFGVYYKSASGLTVDPPTVPDTFVEVVDTWNIDSRFGREVSHVVWTGSGATGNMDGTLSAALADKHGFAVALNPAGGTPAAATKIAALVNHFRQSGAM